MHALPKGNVTAVFHVPSDVTTLTDGQASALATAVIRLARLADETVTASRDQPGAAVLRSLDQARSGRRRYAAGAR